MPNFSDIRAGLSKLTPEEQQQLLTAYPELQYDTDTIKNSLLPNLNDEEKNVVFEKYPDLRPEAGWIETLSSVPGAAFRQLEIGLGGAIQTLGDVLGSETISSIGEPGVTEGQRALQRTEELQNLPQDSWKRTVRDAAISAVDNLSKLPLAAIPGIGPAAALGTMVIQSGGTEAVEAKQAGATPLQAAARGVGYGALEAIGEAVPLGSVMDMLAPTAVKKSIGNMIVDLAKYAGKEIAGEEVTAIGQAGIDLMQKNPNMTMGEFKQTLKDTALQTLMSAPIIGGGATVLGRLGQIGAKPNITPQEIKAATDEQNAITTQSDEEIARRAAEVLTQPEITSQGTPQTVAEPPVVENIQAEVPNAPEAVTTPNERVAEMASENIQLPDRLPIENIKQDAQLQFKRGVDKNLVTDKLKGRKFSELLSGPIDVFVNPEDGQTYVWNGNHRLQLAKDNNRPDVKVTYSNFANMEEAKSAAILKNLAENNGNPMDYRNFFKEAGDTDFKTLLNKMGEDGIDLSKGLAEKGFALSKLSDNLTREYEKGILPEGIAVAIGKNQLTEAAQNSLYKSIKSRYIDQGTAPNASVVKNLIEFARTAPETATEEDMFGNSEVVNNMMIKSEVAEYIGKTIRADKNILKKLSNENLAAAATERELGEIKTEQASAEAQKVALVEMYFKKRMSASGDTIALALNEATQRIVNGETPNKVKGETYVKIRQILESEANNGFKAVTPKPASVEQNIPSVTEKQPERNAATEGVGEEAKVKEPWQMTKEELDNSAWYRGQKEGQRNTGWWSTKVGEAEIYAKHKYTKDGSDPSKKPQILMALNDYFKPEDFEYFDVEHPERYNNASEYRARHEHLPGVQASKYIEIPVERAKDAHKYLVEQALSEGKPVPPEVLAEYPDLKPKPIAQTKKKISEIKTIEELVTNQKNLSDAKVTSVKDGTTATVDYKGKNFTVTETPAGLKYDELLPPEKPVKQEALFEEDLTPKEKDQKAEEKTKGLFGDYLAVPLNEAEQTTEEPAKKELPKPPNRVPQQEGLVGFLAGLNQTDLVRIIEELEAIISIRERFRKDGILGAFYQKGGGKININALLGKVDSNTLAKVIAHELGHLVDWKEGTVNNTLKRGNLLGHIIAQVRFFKTAVNLDPTGTPKVIENKQRRSLWNQARKTVQESAVYYENDLDQKLVSEEYRRLLSEFIDDNNLITNEVAKAELLNLAQVWWNLTDEQVDAQLDYLSKPSELYANAFSAFLTNPQFLHYNAPTVGKMIYDYMTVEKPEFYAVYRDMQNRISAGTNDKSNIEWLNTRIKEATDTRIQELIKRRPDEGLMAGFTRQYVDSMWALQALASKGAKLDTAFLEKVENLRNYKDITEGFIERFFPEVIDELAKQGINIDALGVPAFLKRIIGERGGKQIDVVSKEYASELNKILGTDYKPEQMKAINNSFVKLWENRQPLLKELESLEVFSDGTMDYILKNKDYFTWDVVKKVDETIGKRSPATSAIIKKQIGAFSAVANPYVSTILKDFSLIKFAKKQALVKATLAKLKELGMEVKPAEKKFAHGFWEFQEPNPNTGLALVTVMEKGEVKGYYVEQGIATALENKPTEMSTTAKVVSYINAPIRTSLTSANPVFIFGMNPIRDVVAAFLNMPYTLQHPILWTKLMAKEFAKAMPVINGLVETEADRQYKYKMRSEGKLLGEREAVGDPSFIQTEEDLLKTFYANRPNWSALEKAINKFTGFFSILEWVHNAGKRIEQAPKIAANKFYEQIKDKHNLKESDISYFVRDFAGSPDFRRKGANYGGYNNFFMYSNAMKEGYRATAEAAKYSPKEFALKMAGLAIAPVVLTLLGEAGDPEWWAKVPEYAKSNYMVVPLGYDENKKPVYMRLPMTEAVRFFASAMRKMVKGVRGDDDSIKTLWNLIAMGADEVPMAGPSIQTGLVLSQFLMEQNPYDFFRGRNILSQQEYALRRAEPGTALGKVLQHIWNTNGGGTWYKFHPEYDKLEKSDIEKLTKMPAFGMNILGSFVKTGYDRPVEKEREMQFKIDEKQALNRKLIVSAADKTFAGKVSELTQEEKDAKRANMAYFREQMESRRHPEKAQKEKARLQQKNIKKLGIK